MCNDTLLYDSDLLSSQSSTPIAFSLETRSYSVETNSQAYRGAYEFRLRGFLMTNGTITLQNSITVKIVIVDATRASNSAPYFAQSLMDV